MPDAVMTQVEFAAARESLGLTVEDVAAELDVPLHSVAAMESGAIRVPARVARELIWRVALRQRQAILEASGLPECGTAAAIERAAVGAAPESAVKIFETLLAHTVSCPTCNARSEHLKRHAPVLPEYPMSAWMRAVGWLDQRVSALPGFLRPAEGDGGEGRRTGIIAAAGFSILALGIAVIAAIGGAVSRGLGSDWWREPGQIALLVPIGYFIGFFLAGWGFDVTRRIRHRAVGYVARGALAVAAVYGSIGAVMPVIERDFNWREWPILVAAFAVLGALGGGLLWIIHRLRGKLPSPVA